MHMSCATWCEDQGGIYEIEAASIDNETDGQTSSREKKGLPTNKNSVQRQKWTDIQAEKKGLRTETAARTEEACRDDETDGQAFSRKGSTNL